MDFTSMTNTPTVCSYISIQKVIRVALGTVSLFSISRRRTNTSQYIILQGYSFQMLRINTRTISTEMVDRQPIRNWAYEYLIGQAMSQNSYRFIVRLVYNIESTISHACLCSCPKPTAIWQLFHMSPEPYFWNFLLHRGVSIGSPAACRPGKNSPPIRLKSSRVWTRGGVRSRR